MLNNEIMIGFLRIILSNWLVEILFLFLFVKLLEGCDILYLIWEIFF